MNINVSGRILAPMLLALGLAVMASPAAAAVMVYDFDGLADSTPLTNQVAGLVFSNTTVIKASVSLNETEFPPRSGDGVAFDDGGAISINFSAPVFSVGGYFTYVGGLSLSAFDGANHLLGTVTSAFGANTITTGDPGSSPNELLSFVDAGGLIARVVITGNIAGDSFVLDDLTVDIGNTVPEPQTLLLALALLGAGCLPRGWMRRCSPRLNPGPRRAW